MIPFLANAIRMLPGRMASPAMQGYGNLDKIGGMARNVDWVPVSYLHKINPIRYLAGEAQPSLHDSLLPPLHHIDNLRRDIGRFLHIKPVTVTIGDAGRAQLTGGRHRIAAAQQMGLRSLPVKVVRDDSFSPDLRSARLAPPPAARSMSDDVWRETRGGFEDYVSKEYLNEPDIIKAIDEHSKEGRNQMAIDLAEHLMGSHARVGLPDWMNPNYTSPGAIGLPISPFGAVSPHDQLIAGVLGRTAPWLGKIPKPLPPWAVEPPTIPPPLPRGPGVVF